MLFLMNLHNYIHPRFFLCQGIFASNSANFKAKAWLAQNLNALKGIVHAQILCMHLQMLQ